MSQLRHSDAPSSSGSLLQLKLSPVWSKDGERLNDHLSCQWKRGHRQDSGRH